MQQGRNEVNLILFGFRKVGKTYFGRRLAEKLQRPFFDTDALLVSLHTGEENTPRAIYHALGEAAFRMLERQAIESIRDVQNAVIALGGGAVLLPENRELLQTMGRMIYLQAPFTDPLYEERKALYESIPGKTIRVDLLTEAEVLEELSRGL